MSYVTKTALTLMSGKITFEGRGMDGKMYRATFHKFISGEATAIQIVEEQEDIEIFGDNRPVALRPQPPDFSLQIDGLRLFADGKGMEVYKVEEMTEDG